MRISCEKLSTIKMRPLLDKLNRLGENPSVQGSNGCIESSHFLAFVLVRSLNNSDSIQFTNRTPILFRYVLSEPRGWPSVNATDRQLMNGRESQLNYPTALKRVLCIATMARSKRRTMLRASVRQTVRFPVGQVHQRLCKAKRNDRKERSVYHSSNSTTGLLCSLTPSGTHQSTKGLSA